MNREWRAVGRVHGAHRPHISSVTALLAAFATLAVTGSEVARADGETGAEIVAGDANALEQIVVSAQKQGEERLEDTPIPISVLNPEALTASSKLLLRDYYTSVPGLTVTQDANLGQEIGIRGITESAQTATVAVLVDNIPFSSAAFSGSVGANQQIDIDPGDLERIEVLRGLDLTRFCGRLMFTKEGDQDGKVTAQIHA